MREQREGGYVEPCIGCMAEGTIHYIRPDGGRMHFVPNLGAGERRRTEAEMRRCSQAGCPGDGRYQPPGRGHLTGCPHEAVAWVWGTVPASPPAVAVSTGTSEDVDTVARVLMAAWEAAEGKPVNVSYVATHADMARAVLASDWLATQKAAARADERERIATAIEAAGVPPSEYGPTVRWIATRNAACIAREGFPET